VKFERRERGKEKKRGRFYLWLTLRDNLWTREIEKKKGGGGKTRGLESRERGKNNSSNSIIRKNRKGGMHQKKILKLALDLLSKNGGW